MGLGEGALPSVGEVVHLGPVDSESLALRIRDVEAGEGFRNRLVMIAAAPEIDAFTDAEVPPLWDGRVGAEVDVVLVAPAAPRYAGIFTGAAQTDTRGQLEILLAPGAGSTRVVTS